MTSTPTILLILITVINFISFIISFLLMRNLNRIVDRSFDISVIFVLMASNFAYHLPAMVNIWEYHIILFQIKFIIITFSLCWACYMSHMTFRAATEACMPRSDRYPKIKWVGVGCFVFSSAWILTISTLSSTSLWISLTFLVLIMVIVGYFIKTVKFLRQATNPFVRDISNKVMVWSLSMLTQAFFVGVGTIIQNSCFEAIMTSEEDDNLWTVFLGLILGGALSGMTGIINGILYKTGDKDAYLRRGSSFIALERTASMNNSVNNNSLNNSTGPGYSLM